MHLILYDGTCPLCNRAILFILRADKKKMFLFAPLEGETAQRIFQEHPFLTPKLDTLVLIEDALHKKNVMIEGKGAFRILWLLEGKYRLLGVFSFLPSYLFDLIYRLIAKRRYSLFTSAKKVDPKDFGDRFLP